MNQVYERLIEALSEDEVLLSINKTLADVTTIEDCGLFYIDGTGWKFLASILDLRIIDNVVSKMEKHDVIIDVDSKSDQLKELLGRVQSSDITDDELEEALTTILFPAKVEPETETTVDESAASKIASWFDAQSDTTKVGIGFLSGMVIVLAITALFSSKE